MVNLPENVDRYLREFMKIPSHPQLSEMKVMESKFKLLIATLNVIRLELSDKEPEFAQLIEKSFSLCGIDVDDK